MSDNFPEVYRTERPLHDDWPWPLSYIPRRWTGLELYMAPKKVFGSAEPRWIPIQEGYPLAPDSILSDPDRSSLSFSMLRETHVWGMDPVHASGQWSIQSVYIGWLGFRLPCYFSWSKQVFGRRLHFNGPIKPDVTHGDWFWWIECSLTWTKRD